MEYLLYSSRFDQFTTTSKRYLHKCKAYLMLIFHVLCLGDFKFHKWRSLHEGSQQAFRPSINIQFPLLGIIGHHIFKV